MGLMCRYLLNLAVSIVESFKGFVIIAETIISNIMSNQSLPYIEKKCHKYNV